MSIPIKIYNALFLCPHIESSMHTKKPISTDNNTFTGFEPANNRMLKKIHNAHKNRSGSCLHRIPLPIIRNTDINCMLRHKTNWNKEYSRYHKISAKLTLLLCFVSAAPVWRTKSNTWLRSTARYIKWQAKKCHRYQLADLCLNYTHNSAFLRLWQSNSG